MRDGVRLEAQRPGLVELDDLLPVQKGRLVGVPGEQRRPLDHPGRHEDGRAEAEQLEYRQRILADVPEPVVEVQGDRARWAPSLLDERHSFGEADDAEARVREELHVLPEAARGDRKRIVVLRDAVVEDDSEAARVVELSAGSNAPPGGPR